MQQWSHVSGAHLSPEQQMVSAAQFRSLPDVWVMLESQALPRAILYLAAEAERPPCACGN
jgi:hypothetical protein